MLVAFLLFTNLFVLGAFFTALSFGTTTSFGVAFAILVAMPGLCGILFEQTSRAKLSKTEHQKLSQWTRASLTKEYVALRTGWTTRRFGFLSLPHPVCVLVWKDNETRHANGKSTLILRREPSPD